MQWRLGWVNISWLLWVKSSVSWNVCRQRMLYIKHGQQWKPYRNIMPQLNVNWNLSDWLIHSIGTIPIHSLCVDVNVYRVHRDAFHIRFHIGTGTSRCIPLSADFYWPGTRNRNTSRRPRNDIILPAGCQGFHPRIPPPIRGTGVDSKLPIHPQLCSITHPHPIPNPHPNIHNRCMLKKCWSAELTYSTQLGPRQSKGAVLE